MENKDNQVIITGVHVHDIKWNTTNESKLSFLPVEVDLPFRDNGDSDTHREIIDEVLFKLYGETSESFNFYYKYLGGGQDETDNFPVSYINRDDLKFKGFDITNVTDEDMRDVASVMNKSYLDYSFWEDLEYAAEKIGIPYMEDEDEPEDE